MPMSLNANKSARPGLCDAAGEKLDAVQDGPREAAVYALPQSGDVSSLGALKASLEGAASNARLARDAGEQIGGILIELRDKTAGLSDDSPILEDECRVLAQAINRLAASTAFESGETSFGPIPRDFTVGGPIVNLGDGAKPGFDLAIGRVTSALAEMEAEAGQIEKHIALVARLQAMLAKRVGSLVDADMDHEAARLQALQVQQQLGDQALSLANSQPQAILELFRG